MMRPMKLSRINSGFRNGFYFFYVVENGWLNEIWSVLVSKMEIDVCLCFGFGSCSCFCLCFHFDPCFGCANASLTCFVIENGYDFLIDFVSCHFEHEYMKFPARERQTWCRSSILLPLSRHHNNHIQQHQFHRDKHLHNKHLQLLSCDPSNLASCQNLEDLQL